MASFNKITIVGYLGRDPEARFTSEGSAVCNFSVATTEKRKDKAGDIQEITTWFSVVLFGRQAEVASEYLAKGSHVYLEGVLSLQEWTDRDGVTRTTLSVRGSDIKFLSSTQKAMAATATAPVQGEPAAESDVDF